MGIPNCIRVVEVNAEAAILWLETTFFPDKPPQLHKVVLTNEEAKRFLEVIAARPFGASAKHMAFINSISERAGAHQCTLRITSGGSRKETSIPICLATHEQLHQVFENNIVSEGYIRA